MKPSYRQAESTDELENNLGCKQIIWNLIESGLKQTFLCF